MSQPDPKRPDSYDDCQMQRPAGTAVPLVAPPHSHAPGHEHAHAHAHGHAVGTRRLTLALLVTAALMVAEVVGGVLSNSMALLADAGHMLTDVGALGLSLFVAWFSRQPATPRKTYGYLRWEILAALINGALLLMLSAWIAVEAVGRLRAPEAVAGGLMLGVAIAGFCANAISAWLLHGGDGQSLNVRGAYLHVLSDLLGSVAVITAAVIVQVWGWTLADPIASLAVTLLIVRAAWRLVREAVDILLEGTPRDLDLEALRTAMRRVPGVSAVHDLHVWTLTSGVVALSAHAIAPDVERHPTVLAALHEAVARFGIAHTTIQLEDEPLAACCGEPADSPLSASPV